MPETVPVEFRMADLPQMREFLGAVAALIGALAGSDDLPEPVIAALDRLRELTAAMGAKDVGPVSSGTDEERIAAAMKLARENPGRTITVSLDA